MKRFPRTMVLLVFVYVLNFTRSGIASEELPTVSEYLLETPFSSKHTKQVLAGEVAATDIIPVSETELAQGVACLVKNNAPKNLDAIRIGTWLAPDQQVLLSSQIPSKASLSDFKNVRFIPQYEQELQRFIDVKAGNELNLSAPEISKFRDLNELGNNQQKMTKVEQDIRGLLFNRYQKYRAQGLKGIEPYARSNNKQTQPGKQLMTSLEESLTLKKLYPGLYLFLKQYPQAADLAVEEDYFWYMVTLGDRPGVGLSHRLHTQIDAATFIFERGYYISHTIDSVQVMVALIPVREGTLLIYSNRTWTEEISGLFSAIKRKVAYNIMLSEMEYVMKNLQVCRNP